MTPAQARAARRELAGINCARRQDGQSPTWLLVQIARDGSLHYDNGELTHRRDRGPYDFGVDQWGVFKLR